MAEDLSISQAITDETLDQHARIQALDRLGEGGVDASVLDLLKSQIDKELSGDDSRFVIYLLGAIRRIFDRRAVAILRDLLKRRIDISFRSQCIAGLRELYRHAVMQSAISRDPAARRRLPNAGLIDENFVVFGTDLTDEDLQRIEDTLHDVAEDGEELEMLRDEAREAHLACQELSRRVQ
ncbi:MAG TPA: hypothetical protein VLA93_15290 [Pyrinomonadaceae bacterium]|nr:hypothetical protein [Pyrinomonadaceae bacterium]